MGAMMLTLQAEIRSSCVTSTAPLVKSTYLKQNVLFASLIHWYEFALPSPDREPVRRETVIAGPLAVDCENLYIPMATTEGALVPSVSRGCKAVNESGGAVTVLTADAMTRAPYVRFPNVSRAYAANLWLELSAGIHEMKKTFLAASNFARLEKIQPIFVGHYLYIRFAASTGDAMGMNMSKCVECTIFTMQLHGFHDMTVVALSGNVCTGKKPPALNRIEGRGKSVVAQALITHTAIERVLKVKVSDMVALNVSKNLVGGAVAGSVGGCNAHDAMLYRQFSQLLGKALRKSSIAVNALQPWMMSLPCLEVGTVGSGTPLQPQQAMLHLLGVDECIPGRTCSNSRKLAKIVAAAVLAGELSLCYALASGYLV